jgi:hypothetical protein
VPFIYRLASLGQALKEVVGPSLINLLLKNMPFERNGRNYRVGLPSHLPPSLITYTSEDGRANSDFLLHLLDFSKLMISPVASHHPSIRPIDVLTPAT